MTRLKISLMVAGALAIAACSKQKATTTVPAASVPPEPVGPAKATAAASTSTASSQVGVSDALARACRLHFSNPQDAPKFAYDDFQLLPADREALDQVATCITRGPLKGKTINLIGRADPRGTEEYNLGLGSRRAEVVSGYLQRLGVPRGQLARTTRGDIDAAGSDEMSWRTDRRVDLELRP